MISELVLWACGRSSIVWESPYSGHADRASSISSDGRLHVDWRKGERLRGYVITAINQRRSTKHGGCLLWHLRWDSRQVAGMAGVAGQLDMFVIQG